MSEIRSRRMTQKELEAQPYSELCRYTLGGELRTVYQCDTVPHLAKCVHVRSRFGKPFGREHTHYMYRGKRYRSLGGLIIILNQERWNYKEK